MTGIVSIVMPVYNGAKYIGGAIDSLVAQTHADWEAIVVDDGSTDETASVVAGYTDPRVRYVYQTNHGQAHALNTGLDHARGAYVATLDADDWLTDNSLQVRVQALDRHPQWDAVYSDGWYCTESGRPVMRFSEYRPSNPEGDVYDALILSCFFGTGAPVLIRRVVVEDASLRYDPTIVMVQDWDFYVRLAERATFGYVPDATVWYRLHTANMTMSMPSQRKLDSALRFKRKVLSSPRFATASLDSRVRFFYALLIDTLRSNPQLQSEVVSDPAFRALRPEDQARLVRLVGADYLATGTQTDVTMEWLRRARTLAPDDTKTILVSRAADIHPQLARIALSGWRRQTQAPPAPTVIDRALALEGQAQPTHRAAE